MKSSSARPVAALLCALLVALGLAGCGSSPSGAAVPHHPVPGAPPPDGKTPAATDKPAPPVIMPTGPKAQFQVARQTPAGPIMVTRVTGGKSGVTGKVWVWQPPEYNDPKYARSGFPVLMLFPGGEGNGYNTWTDSQLPIQEIDAQLAAAGKAHPFIMVMPILQLAKNLDTECLDIPGYPKIGTWMSEDVPDFVRANFRTLPGRDGMGLAGASSGAYCAADLVLRHPDRFKAAVPIDGYFVAETPLLRGHPDILADSPKRIAGQGTADVRILATSGGKNPFETRMVESFVQAAKPPTVVEYFKQPGGRHLTSDFKKLIPRTLDFLSKNLQGPVAG